MVLHPRSAARELFRFYRDFMAGAPDELCGGLSILTAPPDPALPEAIRGQAAVGVIILYAGDPKAGQDAFRPLIEWGEPWLRIVEPMPYVAVQQFVDPAHPWGIHEYSKADYLPTLTDEAIDAILEAAAEIRSPFTGVHFVPLRGALDRTDRRMMALELPDVDWYYMYEGLWMDPADAGHETDVARRFQAAVSPWSVGKSVPNFISADEAHHRLRASYGEEKFRRLVALKQKFDPNNVFALNQNIPPEIP
jgi:FAD/FMN-containing dehydrogenase